jgi:hypothetical protein
MPAALVAAGTSLDALFASQSSLDNLLPPVEFGMTMLLIKKGSYNSEIAWLIIKPHILEC